MASLAHRTAVDLQCTLSKHKEAEITVFEVRKCDCCEDKSGEGGGFQPAFGPSPHPRNLCVFYCRTLDLQMNVHCLDI